MHDHPIFGRQQPAALDTKLNMRVVLGTATMPIAKLLKMGRGAVIELDRRINDPVDVYVGPQQIAKAEVVVIDDRLGITVTDMLKSR